MLFTDSVLAGLVRQYALCYLCEASLTSGNNYVVLAFFFFFFFVFFFCVLLLFLFLLIIFSLDRNHRLLPGMIMYILSTMKCITSLISRFDYN